MKVNSINSILGNRNILSNKKAQKNQNNKNEVKRSGIISQYYFFA